MVKSRINYPSPAFSEHWKQGVGKKMLSKLDHIPTEEEIEEFNKLYYRFDELGDRVIIDVFEKQGHKESHRLLNEILENKKVDKAVPPLLNELLKQAETIPSWLDQDLMEAGAAFCRRTGPIGLIVLRNYSLMGGYESAAINKPLIFTGALKAGPAKRLSETLSFWVDVTGENALKPWAQGFKSAVKIRIVHALARVYSRRVPTWSDDLWGAPLNHADMVATYLGFSLVFLEGLKMQGFKPSGREIEGLFHLWKYIGYLLGIHPELLPDTEKQAIAILYKWTITQPPADDDTITLAKALLDAPLFASYPEKRWQKKLLRKVYLGFNHFFLGKNSCNNMQLPNTTFKYLPYLSASLNRIHELKVWYSANQYRKAVAEGRRNQEEITGTFKD